MITAWAFMLVALTTANANPVTRDLVVHEELHGVPEGFTMHEPASGDTILSLLLALRPGDIPGLEQSLYDVSTPGGENYGNHLTQDEVAEFVKPSAASASAVDDWLSSYNLTTTSASFAGDLLRLTVPVRKANEMLDTHFSVFTHQASGKQVVRTLSYAIPATLKSHLDLIHPTVK